MKENTIAALIFCLGEERYAVDTRYVCEIRAYEKPHPVPMAPAYVKGVYQWRDQPVTVIDLRERFGFAGTDLTPTTMTIILRSGERHVAAVVDAVEDVMTLDVSGLQPVPDVLRSVAAHNCVDGLMTLNDKLVTLLDGKRLLESAALLGAAD